MGDAVADGHECKDIATQERGQVIGDVGARRGRDTVERKRGRSAARTGAREGKMGSRGHGGTETPGRCFNTQCFCCT